MAAMLEYFPDDGDLERYVRDLADMIGLRDWKITLESKAPTDDALGQCLPTYGRKIASIRLAEHDTIDELRNTIVHELLHVHLEPVSWGINNIAEFVGDPAFGIIRGGFVDNMELAVDSMATAWAKTLPLPVKAKKKRKEAKAA